jgi:hypothetical protein
MVGLFKSSLPVLALRFTFEELMVFWGEGGFRHMNRIAVMINVMYKW